MTLIKSFTFCSQIIFMLLFNIIPVKSHLDFANCIDNLSDSIKFSFDGNLNLSDMQIEMSEARVLKLTSWKMTSCQNISIRRLIRESAWIFIVSLEENLTEIEIESFLSDLKEAERPLLVILINRDDESEVNYRNEGDERFSRIEINPKIKINLTQIENNFSIDEFLTIIVKNENIDLYFKDGKLIFEAILSQCLSCVRFAQLINETISNKLKVYEEDIENLKCNQQCFKSILNVPFTFEFTEIITKISNFLHQNFINEIKSSKTQGMRIGHNSFTVKNFLNKTKIKMNLEGLSALALSQQDFVVFEFLIRADCPFPQNYTASDKKNMQNLNEYLKEVKKFHENIKNGNYEKVEEFLNKFPNLIFVRNLKNKSALQIAFENRQFKILALLRSHGLTLSNIQEISEHYYQRSKLDKNEKKKIREINRKFITPAIKIDVIDQLMQQSFIALTSKNLNHFQIQLKLRNAFKTLNQIIPDILKVIAAAKNFEIIFDFDNDIVDDFDPTQTYNAGSAFYYRDYAIVAAKFIDGNKYERNNFLGILAHELTHVVMNILYDNEVNPYVLDDKINFIKFNEIAVECRRNMNETGSMKVLFEEKENYEAHGELIARVPDMLLNYANRSKLTYVKKIYKSLFDFYDQKVLKDMQSMHSSMEARIKIQDLNKWLEVTQMIKNLDENSLSNFNNDEITLEPNPKVQIFITNHTKSLLRKIYVTSMNSKELTVFLKSSLSTHEHFREALYEIDSVQADVLLVIYCDDNLDNLKEFKEIFDVLAIERIIFVVKEVDKGKVLKVDFGEKVVKVLREIKN